MIGYDEFIGRIKKENGAADFEALGRAIGGKIAARRRTRLRSLAAGALALLFFGLAAYLTFPLAAGESGQLYSYVFEREIYDGPVIDYVFAN